MTPIVNVAAYKFAPLADLVPLRDRLRAITRQHDLRGTILLSTEGINLCVAGARDDIDAVLSHLQNIQGIGGFPVKESFSDDRPFNRMLVKIKKEIIAFGVERVDPARHTSPRIAPEELKRWLDQGRPVTLLDTRNRFEVQTGTFDGAVSIGVDDFRDFPRAAAQLPDDLKHRPVVTFCTGGIRCEKAAPYLESVGFTDVYQLDGGILSYFRQCGGAHFHGDCFVFDKRVALNPGLAPSGVAQCFVCQAILSIEQQSSPDYVQGESCPGCKAASV